MEPIKLMEPEKIKSSHVVVSRGEEMSKECAGDTDLSRKTRSKSWRLEKNCL